MPWKAVAKRAGGMGARVGWTLFTKLKFLLFGLIFSIMLINAVLISIEASDPGVGVKYIGDKWLLVTEQLGQHSNDIINQGGLYDGGEGFFKGVWNLMKDLYWLFESLIIIYIWLKVLSFVALHMILWDSSKTAVAYLIAIGIFLSGQVVTILAFTDKPLITPFIAFWDFIRAIPYIFKPITNIAEKLMGSGKDLLENNTIT